MPKFKVGDKLQYTGPEPCAIWLMKKGDIAEVINTNSIESYEFGNNNFEFKFIFTQNETLRKSEFIWRGVDDSWLLLTPDTKFRVGDIIKYVGPKAMGINGLTIGDTAKVTIAYPIGSFSTQDEIIQFRFISTKSESLNDANYTWNCYADSWGLVEIAGQVSDQQIELEKAIELEKDLKSKYEPKFFPGDIIKWKGGNRLGINFLTIGDLAEVIINDKSTGLIFKFFNPKQGAINNHWHGNQNDWELVPGQIAPKKTPDLTKLKPQTIILDSLD